PVPRTRLQPAGRPLSRARAVHPGELRRRVVHLPVLPPRTGHQHHARPLAGAHEDVLGPGGTVEEVPWLEEPLLTLDEEPALSGQYEERLLLRLGVVEAVRLARRQDVEPDAELRELELLAL